MELRHLRYFVAVAHEGHVTRAAEKLRMQQPPLSQQIRALEREVDALLFQRHPRGVTLTDAGRSFLADAEAILADVEHAKIRAPRTARPAASRSASPPRRPSIPWWRAPSASSARRGPTSRSCSRRAARPTW